MPRDKDKDTRAKRGGEKANTGEQRVGLGCCSEGEEGGGGGRASGNEKRDPHTK